MSKQANYFKLGVFILAATAVFVAIVLALSAGALFKATVTVETYFNESVQGLDIGSAVKYRGVQIGRVTQIDFTSRKYEQDLRPQDRKQYVMVEAELWPEVIDAKGERDEARLEDMIRGGLRARLAPLGITGTAYLEIDYVDPEANPPLEITWKPENPYIPSSPSTYNRIVSGAQSFLAKLDQTDIEGTLRSIGVLVQSINAKVEELPVESLGKDAHAMLREVRAAARQVSALAASPDLQRTLRDLAAASERMRTVLANPAFDQAPEDAAAVLGRLREIVDGKELKSSLANLDRMLRRFDELSAGADLDIASTLSNLRHITQNLRELTEDTRRYPGSILSDPPKPVTLPAR
jgi:ABC-type transporter Mla subunit MlaD